MGKDYDFPAKEEYRQTLWRAVTAAPFPLKGDAVILPGRAGLEIPHALAAGFTPERVVLVDEDPAVIAPWRDEHPCYGSAVSRAAAHMAEDGRSISLVNADLCGCASSSTFREMRDAGASMPLAETALLAITVQKGRERPDDLFALHELAYERGWNLDGPVSARVTAAASFFAGAAERIPFAVEWGEYNSENGGQSTVSMTWALFLLSKKEETMSVRGSVNTKIPDTVLFWHLRIMALKLGRSPSRNELDAEKGRPSYSAYESRLGGWNNALARAGLNVRPPSVPTARYRYSDEDLLQAMRDLAEELGHTPCAREITLSAACPNSGTYYNRFGSLRRAQRLAGLAPNERHVSRGKKLNRKDAADMLKLRTGGARCIDIARTYGVSPSTVSYALKRARGFPARYVNVPYRGVRATIGKQKRYSVRLRECYIGTFDSAEDAARAYNRAAIEHYGAGNCYLNPVDPVV